MPRNGNTMCFGVQKGLYNDGGIYLSDPKTFIVICLPANLSPRFEVREHFIGWKSITKAQNL